MAKPVGYAHVAAVSGLHEIYFISGQLPINSEKKVPTASFASQARLAFENVQAALSSVGLTFESVVKLNVFLKNMHDLKLLREVREEFLPKNRKPAITTVGTTGLAIDGCLLEIEAVAVR